MSWRSTVCHYCGARGMDRWREHVLERLRMESSGPIASYFLLWTWVQLTRPDVRPLRYDVVRAEAELRPLSAMALLSRTKFDLCRTAAGQRGSLLSTP
jgi:hypothetical protein